VTQNLSEERNELQLQLQDINGEHNRAMQLFVRQGGNLSVIEAELDRLNKHKSQVEYKIMKIDQQKDLLGIQKSFIAFTEKLIAEGKEHIQMIEEYACLSKTDERYLLGQTMKAKIM
jgi:hypothetical protein